MTRNSIYLLLTGILLIGSTSFLSAQVIRCLDADTKSPISDVLIYNETMDITTITDISGSADLQVFRSEDRLFVQHPTYESKELDRSKITQSLEVLMNSKQIELEEVVISASQKLERYDEVPRRINSIRVEEISFYQPQTSADILSQSDQVFVQKSQQGGGSPMIRGFAANRILLVYDNIRLNNAISRGGNMQNILSVDPHFLDRVEVLYGPGTVQYGSDALGGVVHLQSKQLNLGSEEYQSHATGALRYASANNEKTIHADIGGDRKSWAWHTSFSYSEFGDLRMGSNGNDDYLRRWYVETEEGRDRVVINSDPELQKFSGYTQWSFNQKFKFRLDNEHNLEVFGLYSSIGKNPRYDRLQQVMDTVPTYAEWYYGDQNWSVLGVALNSIKRRMLWNNYRINLNWQTWEESRHDRRFQDSLKNSRTENLGIYSLAMDFSKQIDDKQWFDYGLSSYYNDVQSSAFAENIYTDKRNDISTRYPDGGSTLWLNGLYMNYKRNVAEKWHANIGLRYTYQILESKFQENNQLLLDDISMNHQAVNGGLGLTYRPKKRSLFRLNLTSGFRAPNVDDVAKLFDPEPNTVVVPNADLEPEYLYSAELGYQYSDSNRFFFEVNGYYSYLTSAIIRDDYQINGMDSILYDGEMKKVQSLVNKDHAWIYGFNVSTAYSIIKGLQLKLNYTLNVGEDSDAQPIRHISPAFGAFHIIYAKSRFKTDLNLRYSDGFGYDELAPTERNKEHLYAQDAEGRPYAPSWYTLNFMVYYKVQSLQVNIGIENILDNRYRPYASGISAPGRNFILGVKLAY